jgi:hypothetical protein
MKTATIQQKVVIPIAKPEEVYDALMDSKTHSALTESFAQISARIGGKFTAWDGLFQARILHWSEAEGSYRSG